MSPVVIDLLHQLDIWALECKKIGKFSLTWFPDFPRLAESFTLDIDGCDRLIIPSPVTAVVVPHMKRQCGDSDSNVESRFFEEERN